MLERFYSDPMSFIFWTDSPDYGKFGNQVDIWRAGEYPDFPEYPFWDTPDCSDCSDCSDCYKDNDMYIKLMKQAQEYIEKIKEYYE